MENSAVNRFFALRGCEVSSLTREVPLGSQPIKPIQVGFLGGYKTGFIPMAHNLLSRDCLSAIDHDGATRNAV